MVEMKVVMKEWTMVRSLDLLMADWMVELWIDTLVVSKEQMLVVWKDFSKVFLME
jgi:hypothetical protein